MAIRANRIARNSLAVAALLAVCGYGQAALAEDVLHLKSGGELRGTVVEVADAGAYQIQLIAGGTVTLDRTLVAGVERETDVRAEYRRLLRSLPDTVEDHHRMAEWCRENRLGVEFQKHMQRIVQLDPNDETARQMLGFREQDGQWMSRDEQMATRGMVDYQGRFRSPQEVELLKRLDQNRGVEVDWTGRLRGIFRGLRDRDPQRAAAARQELLSIRDPSVAGMIAERLAEEQDYATRRLLVEVAAQIPHRATVEALVNLSLYDPDQEMRLTCLDLLMRAGWPGLRIAYIGGLKSADNEVVNRAASALQTLGDPEAIGPLIDALVTEHKTQSGGSAGQMSTMFTPSGGSGLSMGSSGPKSVTLRNPSALSALVALSGGVTFQYNQEQWKAWHLAQSRLPRIDLRRDP